MSAADLLALRAVRKHFPLRGTWPWSRPRGAVQAVDGVTVGLGAGETLALVGESGCGKSTTARLLLRLGRPTGGEVTYGGRDIWQMSGADQAEYRRSVQAVFQDPSSALSPRRRVRDIVTEPLITIEKQSRKEALSRVGELLSRVGLTTDVADRFPHQLSGGMKQRVAMAQALATRPSVVVLDEPVSALDVSTSAEILNLLKAIQEQSGVAYVLITHNLATVRFMAHQVAAMYLGVIAERGDNQSLFDNALHPYTLALMSASIPIEAGEASSDRIILEGDIPSPVNPPAGCRFHTRCWLAQQLDNPERCRTSTPELRDVSPTHAVACHYTDEVQKTPQRQAILRALGQQQPGPAADAADAGGAS